MRKILTAFAFLIPIFAHASETDAIGAVLVILGITAAWIILHIVFFFLYVLRRTITLMVFLGFTSLGLLITGLVMFFSYPEPPVPSFWDEEIFAFLFLGLLGPLAIMINKPYKRI